MTLQACADIVARGDPDRFAAAMAGPIDARRVLFPLYAFNLEVARAPWVTAEPIIAEMRLQWWREALNEIAAGGPVRRHEVVTPLAEILDPEGAATLDSLISARRWDITGTGFDDDADLAAYLEATAGRLMWVGARTLGAPSDVAPVVYDYAYGAGLAAWFCAIPELEARGRRPLPDGRPGALQVLAREGLRRITRARKGRHAVPISVRPALFAGWQAHVILSQVARDPARVGSGTLGPSPFRKRLGLLAMGLTGRW
ncbi:MAG: squalene/phytoene synthase family protein [Pseudomonadota bacterium]